MKLRVIRETRLIAIINGDDYIEIIRNREIVHNKFSLIISDKFYFQLWPPSPKEKTKETIAIRKSTHMYLCVCGTVRELESSYRN